MQALKGRKDMEKISHEVRENMSELEKAIRSRRSVRTFDGKELWKADRDKIEAFIKTLDDPFEKKIEYRFLSAKEHGLTSPVLGGESIYLAGKIKKGPMSDVAYGYSFEQIILFAQMQRIGTVWIAGTMNRDAFEKAMELKEDEILPAVTPLGYEAKKMAIKETLMRKGVKADQRYAFGELFFENDFATPLSDNGDAISKALEMVRLAPSAVNKQPWRAIREGNNVHFFEHKDRGYDKKEDGDLQKVDVGIGLAHFVLMAKEKGLKGSLKVRVPEVKLPDDTEYIISWIAE